jgi:hypothetical protein
MLPSGNLCKSGTPTLVESGQGSFTWSCAGANGGSTAQCSAPGQLDTSQNARTTFTTPTANGCRIQRAQLLPVPNGGPSGGVTLPYQVCNGQVKQDTLLSRLFIKFPLILNRRQHLVSTFTCIYI